MPSSSRYINFKYCNLFDCLELNKSYKIMIQNMPTFYFKSSKQCYIFLIFFSSPSWYRKGVRAGFCTPFVLRGGGGGAGPLQFYQGGGGFSTPEGASLGKISILKIIIFLYFWYIHIMLLH